MKRMMVLMTLVVLGSLVAFLPKSGSCRRPLPWQAGRCRAEEAAILAATVRLVIHGRIEMDDGYESHWINGTLSHATVTGGRYLITHDHFGIPLSQVLLYNQHANGGLSGVSIYRLDGTAVLNNGPLSTFSVVAEHGETTVLDFGEGFFSKAGFTSVPVTAGERLRISTGSEIAQVDWDEQGRTRVVWAEVAAVYPAGELALMQVEHGIQVGASGGGVFVDGVHVGNNWGLVVRPAAGGQGEPVQRTLVALNDWVPGSPAQQAAGPVAGSGPAR